MKRSLRVKGILQDEDAQAITEFVLTIPVVLLTFFAALQTSVIAQTSQMVNYAAFTSARSYATSYSLFRKDNSAADAHKEAKERAESAAYITLAPVSHAQLGEALFIWNPLRTAAAGLGTEAENLASLVEGYVVAWMWRVKKFKISDNLTGAEVAMSQSFPNPSDADPKKSLHCSFEYLCPMVIPGLREMWNYFYFEGEGAGPYGQFDELGTFDQHWEKGYILDMDLGIFDMTNEFQDFLVSMANMLDNLGGGILGSILGGLGINGSFLHQLNSQVDGLVTGIHGSLGLFGALANIPIQGKCEMGFEPWSGTARLKGGDDSNFLDPALQACQDAISNSQESVAATGAWVQAECEDFRIASNNWSTAEQELNTCQTDTNHPNHNSGCVDETQDEFDRRLERDAAEPRCEDAGDVLEDMNDENSQQMQDACGDMGGNGVHDPGGGLGDL